MSVQISYKNIKSTKNSTNLVLFVDEKFNFLKLKKHISLKVGYLLQGYSSEHNNWSWWWGPIDIFPGQNITNDIIRRDGHFNRMTISLSLLF